MLHIVQIPFRLILVNRHASLMLALNNRGPVKITIVFSILQQCNVLICFSSC